MRYFRIVWLATLPGLLVAGCALQEMSRGLHADEARLNEKQVALAQAESEQAALAATTRRLVDDLQSRRLTLDELSQRLAQLDQQNRKTAASDEQLRRRKQQLEARVRDYQTRIAELQRSNAPSTADKQRRVDELKTEIHNQLLLGLN